MNNVVVFSGGRGSSSLLSAIRSMDNVQSITSLINTYDDGKSSGELRKIFNMPGPSDIRKVQELYLNKSNRNYNLIKSLFQKRINLDRTKFILLLNQYIQTNYQILFDIKISDRKINLYLKKYLKVFRNLIIKKKINTSDLSLMNIIFAGSYFYNKKNINKYINLISKLFGIKEKVYSCGTKNLFLLGINQNNKVFDSESKIVEQRSNVNMKDIFLTNKKLVLNDLSKKDKIKKIYLNATKDNISYEAKIKIQKANIIIYSPGTPFSSLYPSYFCNNIGYFISNNKKAKKILITNIGSDYETPDFDANDYIMNTLKYLKFNNKNIQNRYLITDILVNKPYNLTNSSVLPNIYEHFQNEFNIKIKNYENLKKIGFHSKNKLKKTFEEIFCL